LAPEEEEEEEEEEAAGPHPPAPAESQPRFGSFLHQTGPKQVEICFGEICTSPNVKHHSLLTDSVGKELLLNI
jgi:hypothetical protein